MLNVGRTHNLFQRDKLGDRRHTAISYLNEDIVERLRVEAILRRSCSHDTINLTELVEVTYIGATTVGAQRVEHNFRCNS